MAQVLVRNVAPEVVSQLKRRAERNKRSLEAELRIIFQEAVDEPVSDMQAEVNRVRALFSGQTFDDSTELLREDRAR